MAGAHHRARVAAVPALIGAALLALAPVPANGSAAAEPSAYAEAPAPAGKPSIVIARAAGGGWTADYELGRPAALMFFVRSNPGLDGKPWRPERFIVETPGVRLEQIGRYDAIVADKPVSRFRVRFVPHAQPLTADYTPALAFSDGGLALYTGHFMLAVAPSREWLAALPIDINGMPIDEVDVALRLDLPGTRMLAGGRVHRGKLVRPPGTPPEYIYIGARRPAATAAFAGLVDPGLPTWVAAELNGFLPQLFALYRQRLGPASGKRPTAFVAWQGAEKPGYSLGGSVLNDMVVMQVSGNGVMAPNGEVGDRLRWFFAHEAAHFWLGQTIRYASRQDAWITEGGADWLAANAQDVLAGGKGATDALIRRMQEPLDECLKLTGAGEALAAAEERGESRAGYACGAVLAMVADAHERAATPQADAFTFHRRMIAMRRADGTVSSKSWLAILAQGGAPPLQVERIRRLVESGVADPVASYAELLEGASIAFRRDGDRLVLLRMAAPGAKG